jgi:hypothetical protein
MQGDLNYQGTWNASTNTPTLTSSTGTKGYYYVVDVSGSTNLNGITDWKVGDWAIFNGTVWQKVDNTDAVTSVNGQVGTVVLTTTDVAEGTNQYFTTARARTSVSAGTGISYNNTTGVITNSSPSLGGDVVGPASSTDNAIARFDLATGKLIQNSVVTVSDTGAIAGATTITDINYVDFNTAYATTIGVGQLGWNGNDTLALGMAGGNVIQHIGEDLYFYCKATATITKGQVIMFTGAVGASGVPTGSPATGITDGTYIMGIAAENIALHGFGLIQCFGELRNVNTAAYADGDILWYNPAVTGDLTKTKPSAPNVKVQMATVINGGSAGGGTVLIRINSGSTLGGTDSNAEITAPANGQIITYDGANAYFKNTDLTAGTGISVTKSANGVLTVANTAPSSGGTVTAVTGTAPVVSSGGTAPAISMPKATTLIDGYLSAIDWTTFNNKQPAGSYLTAVTATAPLSGSGTAGSPLIIATANTTTTGALSSTDWNTFNGKQAALVSGTNIKTVNGTSLLGSGDVPVGVLTVTGTAPVVSSGGANPAISLAASYGDTQNPYASKTANFVLAAPNGSAGVPTFRAIVATDIPTLNQNTTGTASNVTGTVAIANGGTGQTTAVAGFNALNPMTTTGDMIYESSPTTAVRLPIGTTGQVLTVAGGIPAWSAAPSSNITTLGLYENSATISANYTIGTGNNAMSAGPITVSTGFTVTVPTGSTWVIV